MNIASYVWFLFWSTNPTTYRKFSCASYAACIHVVCFACTQAKADTVDSLERYRYTCKPCFLYYAVSLRCMRTLIFSFILVHCLSRHSLVHFSFYCKQIVFFCLRVCILPNSVLLCLLYVDVVGQLVSFYNVCLLTFWTCILCYWPRWNMIET